MNYLVTGGAGFIGSHIVERLLKQGHFVRVLDNFSTGRRENLNFVLNAKRSSNSVNSNNFELIEGDICDFDTCQKAVRDINIVIHEAALRSVPKSVDKPLEFNVVNITGTLNLLLAASNEGVKRFVFASSSSIYGDAETLPESEDKQPLPVSPYAATKLSGEYYCRVFAKSYNLATVSLRYFNVFGPRQSLESKYAVVIPKFINCLLNGQAPPVHGDGRQSRDFTYIDNVVDATLLAAVANEVSSEVFNVATGKAYTILDLLSYLSEITDIQIEPQFTPPRPGDIRHTLADISKARKLLGYEPKIDFEEGLRRTVEWFRNRL
jgi:nucleoside-diphosphate-sugar epimerase